MLAGGIVEPGEGNPGAVSAIVAYNPSPSISRLFKVEGPTDEPRVSELPSATTVDLGRFRAEVRAALEPIAEKTATKGSAATITSPKADWVNAIIQKHIDASE